MDSILEQIMQDLAYLAEEHSGTASNEHIFALGSTGEEAGQHEQNAEEHRCLAEMYRKMADDPAALLEQFGGL